MASMAGVCTLIICAGSIALGPLRWGYWEVLRPSPPPRWGYWEVLRWLRYAGWRAVLFVVFVLFVLFVLFRLARAVWGY